MSKHYDDYVTPQNTPRFQQRRILYVLTMGFLIVNLFVFAMLFSESRTELLIGSGLAVGLTVVHCFDNRKSMWTWGYMLIWFLIEIALMVWNIAAFGVYWYAGVLAAETAICCGVSWMLFRKNNS